MFSLESIFWACYSIFYLQANIKVDFTGNGVWDLFSLNIGFQQRRGTGEGSGETAFSIR